MGGEQMHADVRAISAYAMGMSTGAVLGPIRARIDAMNVRQSAMRAFGRGTAAGVFAGGDLMNKVVSDNADMFAQFLDDVAHGMTAIAHAAQVCADAYRGSDLEAADGISLVDFAFADPDATRPPGLKASIGQTLAEQQQAGVAVPGAPMALDAGLAPATVFVRDDYSVATYADGSSRVVRTMSGSKVEIAGKTDEFYPDGTIVTETTIYAPGVPAMVASTDTYYAGPRGVVETQTHGVGKGASTTTRTTRSDGQVTISVEADGKQVGKTVTFNENEQKSASTMMPVTDKLADMSMKDQVQAARDADRLLFRFEHVPGQ